MCERRQCGCLVLVLFTIRREKDISSLKSILQQSVNEAPCGGERHDGGKLLFIVSLPSSIPYNLVSFRTCGLNTVNKIMAEVMLYNGMTICMCLCVCV